MIARKYKYFVGIDVSKEKLDCAFLIGKELHSHVVIDNTEMALLDYVETLKALPDFKLIYCVFGFEQTGIYTAHALAALRKAKANIVLEDAVVIRNLLGKLKGKFDKVDAIRVATFLYKSRLDLRLWEPRRKIILELSNLISMRARLLSTYHSLKVPLKEAELFNKATTTERFKSLCSASLSALQADVKEVEKEIVVTVNQDERIKRLYAIITSVQGVGMITAIQMIISTNEFIDIKDPKKFASYAGVAPFRKESGGFVGRVRISQMANKRMKTLLHICAVSSIAYKNDLKDYYIRKTEGEGKPKMAVLNAIRYKIILRVFACLSQDRLYEKNYKSETGAM
jgi:transposase